MSWYAVVYICMKWHTMVEIDIPWYTLIDMHLYAVIYNDGLWVLVIATPTQRVNGSGRRNNLIQMLALPNILTKRIFQTFFDKGLISYIYNATCQPSASHLRLLVEPFLCVRTNPTIEQAKLVNSLDLCRAICGSVFIMLVDDNALRDQVTVAIYALRDQVTVAGGGGGGVGVER